MPPKKKGTKKKGRKGTVGSAPPTDLSQAYEWGEAAGVDDARVEELFNQALISEQQIHPALSAEDQGKRALRRTRIAIKRESGAPGGSQGELFEMLFIGIGGMIDTVRRVREEAEKLFQSNPDKAVGAGICNEAGEPLETREYWGTGTKNPGFGKPLAQWNNIRPSAVIVKKEDEVVVARTTLDANAEYATDPPELFTVHEAKVTSERDDDSGLMLNFSRTFGFITLEKELDPEDVLRWPALEEYWTSELDMAEYIDEYGDRSICIMEGDVTYMDLDPEEGMSQSLYIDDESDEDSDWGVRVWLPDWFEPDFSVDSRVIVLGNPRHHEQYGGSMQAMAIHAIEAFKIPAPDIEEVPATQRSKTTKTERMRKKADKDTFKDEIPLLIEVLEAKCLAAMDTEPYHGADYEKVRNAVYADSRFGWSPESGLFDDLLTSALDKGLVFEPQLGFLKPTDTSFEEEEEVDDGEGQEEEEPSPKGRKKGQRKGAAKKKKGADVGW